MFTEKQILLLRHSFQLESSRAPPRALINAALSRRASRTPPSVDSRGLAGLQRSRRALRAAELTCLLESSPPCFVVRAPPCAACLKRSRRAFRAAELAPRSRRPQAPPCAAPLCFCTFGALPSPRENSPSGQEGRVITLKPGLALPSQREHARLEKSRHRSL